MVAAHVLALEPLEDGGEIAQGGFGGLVDVVHIDFTTVLDVLHDGAGAAGEFLLGAGFRFGGAGFGGGEGDLRAFEFAFEIGEPFLRAARVRHEAVLEQHRSGDSNRQTNRQKKRGTHEGMHNLSGAGLASPVLEPDDRLNPCGSICHGRGIMV